MFEKKTFFVLARKMFDTQNLAVDSDNSIYLKNNLSYAIIIIYTVGFCLIKLPAV